ncbi:hypothetical protein AHF37_11398, partial [Paragonimus kellicotti]
MQHLMILCPKIEAFAYRLLTFAQIATPCTEPLFIHLTYTCTNSTCTYRLHWSHTVQNKPQSLLL